jgi:hypothetical protein
VCFIPTPSIPKGRAFSLKNYRSPEVQQQEAKEQIQQILKDEIITPKQKRVEFFH